MNVDQMRAALKAFGALMGGTEASALVKFANLFEGIGDAKAASVVAQVSKNWATDKRPKKRPAELYRAIRRIQETLTAVGATPHANVFTKTLALLEGKDDQDVDSFVSDAITARVKRTQPPKMRGKAAKPKFADAVAPNLGHKLSAVAGQRARFDALLNEYQAAYKPAELRAIAHCFMGYEVDKKKKDEIIKAMRNWQLEAELNDDIHAAQAKIGV